MFCRLKKEIIKGMNFCQVIRIIDFSTPIVFETLTNHLWNGENAIFNIKANKKTVS